MRRRYPREVYDPGASPRPTKIRVAFTWLAIAAAMAMCAPSVATAKRVKVTSLPVAFQVKNTNTTAVPCTPDGATYTVRGHLTGPAKGKRSGVALYLHGLGLGEWLWNFQQVKSYNHALGMARAGHVSVTVDRLGYGASDKPPSGKSVCIGSQADIAHQIVAELRQGTYTVEGGKPRRFKRVGLVGHSAAGQIAITESYTYRDVKALVVVGFSFSNLPRGNDEFGFERIACDAGGDPVAGLTNYAFFGRTAAGFRSTMFHSAPKAVQDAGVALHYPDPCGDNYSLIAAIARQPAGVGKVKVPTLVVCGRNDVLYAPFGCEAQAERFSKGRAVILRNTGHGVPLEATARTFRKRLGRFLDRARL
jgi:pimeloyl-ACP methyl ester carboxylesterase